MSTPENGDWSAAVAVMQEATSWFVQDPYASEALDALVAAGWTITPPDQERCICPRFSDTGGFRIADLGCPVHGVDGTDPGDGYWTDDNGSTTS